MCRRSTIFDADYANWALKKKSMYVLKYINILHEMCVRATAAAATVDLSDKWAKRQ